MKNTLNLITWVYQGLLWLYPPRFRREFGDEMQTVLGDILAANCPEGRLALLRTCMRELWDMPGSIHQAYIQEYISGGMMKRKIVTVPPVLTGALGFAFAYVLMTLFNQVVYRGNFEFLDQSNWTGLMMTLISSLIIAGVGGTALALYFPPQKARMIYLVVALGWLADILTFYVKVNFIDYMVGLDPENWWGPQNLIWMGLQYLPVMAIGFLLGWIMGGLKWALPGLIAGILGEVLGTGLSTLIDPPFYSSQGSSTLGQLSLLLSGTPAANTIVLLALRGLTVLLRGAVLGGLLGLLITLTRRKNIRPGQEEGVRPAVS